mgnify:CR=1 FL=1
MSNLEDRIATIADEACGLGPVATADENLSRIEGELNRLLRELVRAEQRAEDAESTLKRERDEQSILDHQSCSFCGGSARTTIDRLRARAEAAEARVQAMRSERDHYREVALKGAAKTVRTALAQPRDESDGGGKEGGDV